MYNSSFNLYDPSFNYASLSNRLLKSDFKKNSSLYNDKFKTSVVNSAMNLAKTGFLSASLKPENLAGRKIFQLSNISEELVLRKATENLKKISKVKQSDRISIVKRLKLFCEEGTAFQIAKFDIKNFFESIDTQKLEDRLAKALSTSPATELVLKTFLQQCRANEVVGLPAGIPISAILSEFLLRDFDKFFKNDPDILFYARYVDDIIMVLVPELQKTSFKRKVLSELPDGLQLNTKKTKTKLLKGFDEDCQNLFDWGFEYLGYGFTINTLGGKKKPRKVKLDIGITKIKKQKTRLILAFRQYLEDNIFEDLLARIRLITCNYKFYDQRKGRTRSSGNRHIYSLIDQSMSSLVELDSFLKKILLSGSGKISGPLCLNLSKSQKIKIIEQSFVGGFKNRVHFSFKPEELKRLLECWKYA